MGKVKVPRRPSYVRCGDKRYITFVFMLTAKAMVTHWRELPALWRDTAHYRRELSRG